MSKYIMRLDDAAERMDLEKWNQIEAILDKYGIKPLVGVIPDCKDPEMDKFQKDEHFWEKVHGWINKDWEVAMHGYEHVYHTNSGGINPINKRSEFAGLPYEEQRQMISSGYKIMLEHGIAPKVFFAPSHTFDENTIEALRNESDIRYISDTISWNSYKKDDFYYVPQQSGQVRRLPFPVVTFCYHPNSMKPDDFLRLESFLKKNSLRFNSFTLAVRDRKRTLFDSLLKTSYFFLKRKR